MFFVTLHDIAAHSTEVNERNLAAVAVIHNVCWLQIAMLLSLVAAVESSNATANPLEDSHEFIEVAFVPEFVNDERKHLALCPGHHHYVTKVVSTVVLHPDNLCGKGQELIRNDLGMFCIDLEQVIGLRQHCGMPRLALHDFENHFLALRLDEPDSLVLATMKTCHHFNSRKRIGSNSSHEFGADVKLLQVY